MCRSTMASAKLHEVQQQMGGMLPQAKQHRLWQQFDDDTSKFITSKAKESVELQYLTTIITSFRAERFGVKEPKSSKPSYTNNQRADKIH